MASTARQLDRLVALAASLGADLDTPEIREARATYERTIEAFTDVATEQQELTSLFANFDPDAYYVGGPRGVAELQFLSELGLSFANGEAAAAGDFWETLSAEEALTYPADIIFNDVYSSLRTVEDLQGTGVYGAMPAVEAGQVGLWKRDFPVSYAGITDFLETILTTLRAARPLTSGARQGATGRLLRSSLVAHEATRG